MYLMIVNRQIVGARNLHDLFEVLEEVYGGTHPPTLSIRPEGYVLQARFPGDDTPKPLVAALHKQYPTPFIVLPVLPFSLSGPNTE
jgi:hypothetical protein